MNKIISPFLIILGLYYIATTLYILENDFGYIVMIASLTIEFLLIWSHFQIVQTQSGPITITNTPIELMQQKNCRINAIIENEKQLNNICLKCKNAWKPPKSHHCATCNKCIHYRDHHCFWFNCCVGYKNLKYFCQFLLYFIILITIRLISCQFWLIKQIQQIHKAGLINIQLWPFYTWFSYENLSKLFELFIIFSGYFIAYRLLRDKKDQLPDLTTYNESKKNKYIYYRNFKCNLIRLLGSNPFYWILPIPNKMNLNYLELTYPKVTAGQALLDYHLDLDQKDKDYDFYKIFQIK